MISANKYLSVRTNEHAEKQMEIIYNFQGVVITFFLGNIKILNVQVSDIFLHQIKCYIIISTVHHWWMFSSILRAVYESRFERNESKFEPIHDRAGNIWRI